MPGSIQAVAGNHAMLTAGFSKVDPATIAAVIAALALVTNLVTNFLSGSWKINTRLSEIENGLREAIAQAKTEIEERQDAHRREMGEAIHALRTKINEVELNSAKEYIRRDSFYTVRNELASQIAGVADRMEARLVRMEGKIDTKT